MKPKATFLAALSSVLCSSVLHASETLVDDFTGDLSAYTGTVILDANGGDANAFTWQITDETLELDTTTFDGIEQYAFIRSGLALAVGEELQIDLTHSAASQDIGLYVGGTTPVAGTREDYIAVYARDNGQVFSRGFDGLAEYGLTGGDSPVYERLFIARSADNEYQAGYYVAGVRTTIVTRTPTNPNGGDVCGFYADVRAAGTLGNPDNLCISAIAPEYQIAIDAMNFPSGDPVDSLIGVLSATLNGLDEESTFALIAGDGDEDNDLFKIGGSALDELQVNADFTATGEDPFSSQTYAVRIQGTDTTSGTQMAELPVILTVFKDDDLDTMDDEWEIFWQGNLTDLDEGEDKDGDELFDEEEYLVSIGEFGLPAAYDVDPDKADSDGDMLTDGEETIVLVGSRSVTNPTEPDTDFDGLTDLEETNSLGPETAPMVGTDGAVMDTDGDGAKDGYEVENGTDPLDDTDFPPSASDRVTVAQITDDASTGISSDKTYTHAISGGYATTVNGVDFEVLDIDNTATNFNWLPDGDGRNAITEANLGEWEPGTGGVTGTEVIDLLSGFTFSQTAEAAGSNQQYVLSGLTPGASYELRLYLRSWKPFTDSGRPLDLAFTNGTEVVLPYCSLLVDRPGYVLGTFNDDDAYYLSFSYTAQETELTIDATIPLGAPAGLTLHDTLHLYGLTNELTGGGNSGMAITDVFFDGGDLKVTFTPGGPGFILSSSDDLVSPFTEVTGATYDDTDTFTVPAAILNPAQDFFRVEDAP